MAADPVFIDTNVLVFATFDQAPWHAASRKALEDLYAAGAILWVSRQVLRECLVQLTRPQPFGTIPHAEGLAAVEEFTAQFSVANETEAVSMQLRELVRDHCVCGKQVHDANIVATMIVEKIPELLTWNTKDFARFGSLIRGRTP